MNRFRSTTVALLAGAALLAGCGSEPAVVTPAAAGNGTATCTAPAGPVAIAMSGRANSPAPTLPPIAGAVLAAALGRVDVGGTGSMITLVNVDGRPESVGAAAFKPSGKESIALERSRGQFEDSFATAASQVRAQVPEVNGLAALGVASDAAGEGGTVVFADSGLQTMAPLDYRTPGLLDADPAEVVAFLERTEAIPDLTGRTVFLVGIGDTAAPQAPLDVARAERLEAVWEQIALAGDAACVAVVGDPRGGDAPADVPPVSLVDVPPPPGPTGLASAVLPDDGTVGFVAGRAELRNHAAAALVLQPLADALIAAPTQRIRLTGTTARHGDLDGQIDLAGRRAETIKAIVVDLGAAPDQIETVGLGSEFPQYINDQGPGGTLLPGPAAQNRSVRIDPI